MDRTGGANEGSVFNREIDAFKLDLVLFDTDAPFVLDRFTLMSKSKNTPFDGARMEGKVLGTWAGGRRIYAEGQNA